jgi:hypothetical protein
MQRARFSIKWALFYVPPNAGVQPQIRAQREFVGWNALLDAMCGTSRVVCCHAHCRER